MTHRRHFAVDRLSREGQAAVRAAVDRDETLEGIRQALREATGETVAVSSLHRWLQAERVRRRIERRQQAVDAALQMVQADPEGRMANMVRLALEERLLDAEDKLGELEFGEQIGLWQQMAKVALQHKRINIAERDVMAAEKKADAAMLTAQAALKVAEGRLEAMQEKAREAAKKLEDAEKQATASGRSLTPDELRIIREEVFGFASAPEPEVAHG